MITSTRTRSEEGERHENREGSAGRSFWARKKPTKRAGDCGGKVRSRTMTTQERRED